MLSRGSIALFFSVGVEIFLQKKLEVLDMLQRFGAMYRGQLNERRIDVFTRIISFAFRFSLAMLRRDAFERHFHIKRREYSESELNCSSSVIFLLHMEA